jgi:DNA invertase Pin-like site-specific DNA recombinase
MTCFKGALNGAEMEQEVFIKTSVVEVPILTFMGREIARKRAAIYARVSTVKKRRQNSDTSQEDDARSFEQRPEIQIEASTALATQRGWRVAGVYQDRASEAKEKRPELYQLMTDARRGQFDVVVVWRFDRFARSVKQLVLALEEFRALNIDFVSHQESLDTSTPVGKRCSRSLPLWPNPNEA